MSTTLATLDPAVHPLMNQNAIDQLDQSISEVFTLLLNRDCNLTPNTPVHTDAAATPPSLTPDRPGLTASISFSGSMRGTCSIHLPIRTATALTGEIIGPMPDEEAATLNADTAGEICNMIAGSWKSRQPDPHARAVISTPYVTLADLHILSHELTIYPEGSPEPFRHLVSRIYSFEDHQLHLKLGFD